MRINYIYWITTPKAGSGIIEIESGVYRSQDMET